MNGNFPMSDKLIIHTAATLPNELVSERCLCTSASFNIYAETVSEETPGIAEPGSNGKP
jgi:hypothetical protein